MNNFNLLPWREQLREAKRQRFYVYIAVSIIGSVSFAISIHIVLQQRITYQHSRNHYLNDEIQILNQKIQEVSALKKQRNNLIERINTIETLQAMRPASVHLFDEISSTLPQGIYLTHLLQSGSHIHLVGKTKSNTHVSEYMNRLNQSKWLSSSNLKGISTKDETRKNSHLRDFDLQVTQRLKHTVNPLLLVHP